MAQADLVRHVLGCVREGRLSADEGFKIVRALRKKPEDLASGTGEIAVIGMSGQFPGARNLEEFWANLAAGRDSISEVPPHRWDLKQFYDPDPDVPGKSPCRWGGFLPSIREFDPLFFGISPREAERMDPQQRLFLEAAWNAFEDAGYAGEDLRGKKCGVFAGCKEGDYRELLRLEALDAYAAIGSNAAILAARISYLLDLRGPSLTVDTACSSALLALHLACESLRSGACEMALAGGVAVMSTPGNHVMLGKTGMLSPRGRCRTFDAGADGFVPGEGVGAVVLKPLSRALADKDHVYGVIRGSGTNQDGRTSGITAPSGLAQEALETEVYERFGIDPASVTYIETHGTGTRLGDPIEVHALTAAFRKRTSRTRFAAIGSVKTNIGHALAAAGIAGLLKVLLCLERKTLVPSLHFEKENELLELSRSPFFVNTETRQWETEPGQPRLAAVSSFGFSGTNVHVVVSEAPARNRQIRPVTHQRLPFVFSARAEDALRRRLSDFQTWLSGSGHGQRLEDIAFTLFRGRARLSSRAAIVAATPEELASRISSLLASAAVSGSCLGAEGGENGAGSFALGFVRGEEADERTVFGGLDVSRVSLPGYPFARDSYWIPDSDARPFGGGAGQHVVRPAHPMVHHVGERDGDLAGWVRLTGEEFFLRDHVVGKQRILPGVAVLEMARAAAELCCGETVVALRNVIWGSPLTGEGAAVEVSVQFPARSGSSPGSRLFEVWSNPPVGARKLHSSGTIVFSGARSEPARGEPARGETVPERVDLGAIRARMGRFAGRREVYARFAEQGFAYGPAFQTVAELAGNESEAFARLEMPSFSRGTASSFGLHPGLLDGALQALLGVTARPEGPLAPVPFGLSEIELHRPLPETCFAWLTLGRASGEGLEKFDVRLLSEAGEVLVHVRDLAVRSFRDSAPAPAPSPGLETTDGASALAQAERLVREALAREVKIQPGQLGAREPFESFGVDSMMVMSMTRELEKSLGELPKTLFFEHRTVADLAASLAETHASALLALAAPKAAEAQSPWLSLPVSADGGESLLSPHSSDPLPTWAGQGEKQSGGPVEPVAIIGMSGRYPMAEDLDAFWENLKSGRDCITEIPADRWDYRRDFDPNPEHEGKSYSRWGGFLPDVTAFDPLFFRISPRDAEIMDPQERLFLEASWEALEDAGYAPGTLGTKRVGVFAGVMYGHYQLYGAESGLRGKNIALGSSYASIANRVSFTFDFKGPSLALDSMCSSSLSALHLACESLRRGEVDVALAGGVNVTIHPQKYLLLSQAKVASTDGRCRSFGAGGDGYVPGEGVGVLLLKPLAKALADGDHVHGLVLGTAISHGGRTNGYTVPDPAAQAEVIGEALTRSGVNARTVSYLEAHGTGTSLGDPIEVAGLAKAYRASTSDCQFCAIGSLKSNIGHLESAAGVASVTKVLLQMRHGFLVPSLHAETPNPHIDFSQTPFVLQRRGAPWVRPVLRDENGRHGIPRRSGVSSFGAGGANAHVILEEFDHRARSVRPAEPGSELFILSARNRERLQVSARRLAAFLERRQGSGEALLPRDVAFTLQAGREAMDARLAIVASSLDELTAKLRAFIEKGVESEGVFSGERTGRAAPVPDPADELHQKARLLLSSRGLEALARLWAGGAALDWPRLRAGDLAQRVPLPTYPFARERYWAPDALPHEPVASGASPIDIRPVPVATVPAHRLIGRGELSENGMRFSFELSPENEIIGHHVVRSRAVLPAAALLEMARAAGVQVTGQTVRGLSGVAWRVPVDFPHGVRRASLRLGALEGESCPFELAVADTQPDSIVAEGRLLFGKPALEESEIPVDLASIWKRCANRQAGPERYEAFRGAGMAYGERYSVITESASREGEAIARVALPSALVSELGGMPLHPSLLDGALQAVAGVEGCWPEGSLPVPYSIGSIRVLGSLPPNVVVHARLASPARAEVRKVGCDVSPSRGLIPDRPRDEPNSPLAPCERGEGGREAGRGGSSPALASTRKGPGIFQTFHVDICDSAGRLLVVMREVAVKAVAETETVPQSPLLYAPVWVSSPAPAPSGPRNGVLVLVEESSRLELLSVVGLRAKGVTVAIPGRTFGPIRENTWEIRPGEVLDFRDLLGQLEKSGASPSTVIHAWTGRAPDGAGAYWPERVRGIGTLFALTRALLERKLTSDVEILFFHPAGPDGPDPVNAGVSGFARSLMQENPRVKCRVTGYDNSLKEAVEKELAIAASREDVEVLHEAGKRRVRRMERVTGGPGKGPLREKGTYLITGGLHGIGFHFARFLSSRLGASLVLTGRSQPSDDTRRKIELLDSLGGRAVYLPGDVTEHAHVRRLVAEARDRFGSLNGVLHAAGVLRDGFLLKKTEADFEAVLAPKVAGALVLDDVTRDVPLDLFVLFSSLAGTLGNVGQADYAYANAFLDAFAARRERFREAGRRHGRSLSIGWAYWKDGGMRMSAAAERLLAESGLVSLDEKSGLAAFERCLAVPGSHLAVVDGDASRVDLLMGVPPPVLSPPPPSPSRSPFVTEERAAARPGAGASSVARAAELVTSALSSVIKIPVARVRPHDPFLDYGVDSVTALGVTRILEETFGPLPKTLLFEHGNVAQLAEYLARQHAGRLRPAVVTASEPPPKRAPEPELVSMGQDIAIIGLSGRYPMARDLGALWEHLSSGRDCITEVPKERWGEQWFDEGGTPGKSTSRWGGFLEGVDHFDPRFFGITPREAELMDPQERLFLEIAWQTLEDAGLTRAALAASQVGVFAGVMWAQYQMFAADSLARGEAVPASSFASIANRVSYFCGFTGPSLALDTMCSSSLTAIHLACQSLLQGECDIALAGGVNVSIHPHKYVLLSQGRFVSRDGRCRAFGAGADGYVPGEGVGAVLLKPLARALSDGDPIRAVIKASAVNHGGRSAGYSVPNAKLQAALIQRAIARSGVEPGSISYIEAHGTGTSLGDPIEMRGLEEAFRSSDARPGSCAVGSIKSNIGHLESAAGIAGLTKVVLQLEHRQLVPTLHAEVLNPELALEGTPFHIQRELARWQGSPLRAGLSSFGAGGANAHLIIEEAPSRPARTGVANGAASPQLVLLSARSPERLRDAARQLAAFTAREPQNDVALVDIARTSQVGREAMEERLAVLATSLTELRDLLSGFAGGAPREGQVFTGRARDSALSGGELAQVAARWLAEGNQAGLAQLWVAGADFDWSLNRATEKGRRVSLPPYPFARERYWVTSASQMQQPAVKIEPEHEPVTVQAAAVAPDPRSWLETLLHSEFKLRLTAADDDVNFADLGLDSVLSAELIGRMERELGPLPKTLILEYPTVSALSLYLATQHQERFGSHPSPSSSRTDEVQRDSQRGSSEQPGQEDGAIAVIGLAGRYPKAINMEEFWSLLSEGHTAISRCAPERWKLAGAPVEDPGTEWGAFLDGIEDFDPFAFNLTPLEARGMPPEERLLLEVVWQTLEDAGYSQAELRGRDVGIFVGATANTYPLVLAEMKPADLPAPDTSAFALSNRVSYFFDWTGPSFVIDTACSSSLVAIHLACESLRRGECTLAVAGGVNLYLHPSRYRRLAQGRLLSTKGPRALYERGGEGFVPGEGAGTVLLKPLSRALAEGDRVLGVIRASGVSHKGRSNGFHAPSPHSQPALLARILASAGLDASSISYVEAQALGAEVPDAVEWHGLERVFGEGAPGRCALGCLKPAIGHLEAASGIAQLTKILLQIRHGELAPVPLARERNPEIRFEGSPFFVPETLSPWKAQAWPRRAVLGSFGAGGVEAFLVAEEPPVADTVRRQPLPARAFERVRCWVDGPGQSQTEKESRSETAVARYYDAVTPGTGEAREIYLTFAPFPEPVDGFSWLKVMTDPGRYPSEARLVTEKQLELRDVALRSVDTSRVRRLLDIGCGLASDILRLLKANPALSADGYTISPAQAKAGDERLRRESLAERGRLFCRDSATEPFPGVYDLIIGFEVTFHVEKKTNLFANIAAHLAPGGRVVLIDVLARTAAPVRLPARGQFTSTVSEWSRVLGSAGLRVTQCVDASREIANFLRNPDFEADLALLGERQPALLAHADEHRGWHGFGLALETGLLAYVLLTLEREEHKTQEALAISNENALLAPVPYRTALAELRAGHPRAATTFDFRQLEAQITAIAARSLGTESTRLDPGVPLAEYGVGSLLGLKLLEDINRALGCRLEMKALYDHPTLRALARHAASEVAAAKPAVIARDEAAPVAAVVAEPPDAIAVIGMAGRFPLARNVSEFWRNLEAGIDAVTEVPESRWDWRTYFDPNPRAVDRTMSRWGGFIDGVDEFDPAFFRISPAEAEVMDPQQRLFLQTCWTALEDAGYAGAAVDGARCGVVAGALDGDYRKRLQRTDAAPRVAQSMLGNSGSILASRIAYFLNLKGPALSVNTACSSALVAVHLSCESLRRGETDLMLAGGVTLYLDEAPFILMSKAGMLSPTGRCRTFDDAADGIAVGEAVAVVVLKRLNDARRDGDRIHGVIRASGVNQDGRTNGITAPSGEAQTALILDVLTRSGVHPESIGCVEAHGTGTRLGDPIEVRALTDAFRKFTDRKGFCALGSVKSNLGHTSAAAGAVSLIKVLSSLGHGRIPQTLHVTRENAHLDFPASPFFVNKTLRDWPARAGMPRRAAISSFGYSGTNCHVILEEAPVAPVSAGARQREVPIVPLSARSEERLRAYARELLESLQGIDGGSQDAFLEVAAVFQLREPMEKRVAFAVSGLDELRERLKSFLQGEKADGLFYGRQKIRGVANFDPDRLLQNGDWVALAQLWVSGAGINFRELRKKAGLTPPRRHLDVLPTYPFARNRYWLSVSEPAAAASIPAPTVSSFRERITSGDSLVKDHLVGGERTLPGVAVLEMACARAERAHPGKTVTGLRDVVWSRPIRVAEGGTVEIDLALEDTPGGITRFTLLRDSSEYARGQVVLHGGHREDPGPIDLAGIWRRCTKRMESAEFYQHFGKSGVVHGPSLRSVRELFSGNREALARLERPEESRAATARLDPALLDGAFQAVLGILGQEGGTAVYLPYALESLDILGGLPASGYAHAVGRPGDDPGTRRFDIVLTDDAGRAVISLAGLALRAVTQPGDRSQMLPVERVWTPSPLALPAPLPPGEAFLLLDTPSSRGDALRRALAREGSGGVVVEAIAGNRFGKLGGQSFEMRPGSPDDARTLIRELEARDVKPKTILHLWSCGAASLDEQLTLGFESCRLLARALAAAWPDWKANLVIGLRAGEAGAEPALCALGALARSLSREAPRISCRVIQLPAALFSRGAESNLVELLLAEARSGAASDYEVRYAGKERLVQRFEEITTPLRPAGAVSGPEVSLITGGAGGLGRLFARHLAKGPGAKLVLCGRSPLNERITSLVKELETLGAEAIYVAADVTKQADVTRLLSAARDRFHCVHAIYHAAGVAGLEADGRVDRTALTPKILGAVHLDEATRGEPLRLFVLFSSVAAVLGDGFQPGYAFANSFLDHFAGRRDTMRTQGQRRGQTLSIAWPLWRDGGMQAGPERQRLLATFGMEPLGAVEGLAAFEAAVASGKTCWMPLFGDVKRLRRLISESLQPVAPAASVPAETSSRAPIEAAERGVREAVCEILRVKPEDIDLEADLRDYGFDSISFTELANRLNDRWNLTLTPALFFEHSSLGSVASALAGRLPAPSSLPPRPEEAPLAARVEPDVSVEETRPAPGESPCAGSVNALAERQRQTAGTQEPIAIIGMSGAMPGSLDLETFWRHLALGHDLVTEVPKERWDSRREEVAPGADPIASRGGFMPDVDRFDAAFFGISPREASLMDPQQRLFLEAVWAAIEDAGYRASDLAGTATGVFAGVASMDYGGLMAKAGVPADAHTTTGISHSVLVNRVSSLLDLHGPSEPIDTACSSSLIAIHRAIESIRGGDCDLAIAGGVNALLSPDLFVAFSKAGMLSPDGCCRTFDSAANGYVRGEGVGAVLLKPLSRAIADGDHIHGVVRGSAENHGGRAPSLTAPNPKAQAAVIIRAHERAGVDPASVTYLEAHGTGTRLGDPIEVNALREAFSELFRRRGEKAPGLPYCGLGSVKTNIGHLETAAGIAGVLKVLLSFRHKQIPASLHFKELNSYIELTGSPFYVVDATRDWAPALASGGRPLPRRAGVSSFGFGGANAHLVLEEFIPGEAPATEPGEWLFVLSARSEERLQAYAGRLARFVEAAPELPETEFLSRLAFTLQAGREPMDERLAITAKSRTQLREQLRRFSAGEPVEGLRRGSVKRTGARESALIEGEEGREFVRALVRKGHIDKLARLWVSGAEIDWGILYRVPPRRISAPSYPFERRRFWFDVVHEVHAVPAPAAVAHVVPVVPVAPVAPSPVPSDPPPTLLQASPPPQKKILLKRIAPEPAEQASDHQATPLPVAREEHVRERPAEGPAGAARLAAVSQQVLSTITSKLARVLYLPETDVAEDRSFGDMGLDSILGVELIKELNRTFGLDMKASRLFDHPTAASLAAHVSSLLPRGAAPGPVPETKPPQDSGRAIQPASRSNAQPLNGMDVSHISDRIRFHLAEVLR